MAVGYVSIVVPWMFSGWIHWLLRDRKFLPAGWVVLPVLICGDISIC